MDRFNVFAGAFVDRRGEHRLDAAWLSAALTSQETYFVPVHDDKCLVIGDPPRLALLEREEISAYLAAGAETVFLGLFRDTPAFAVIIESDREPPSAELGQYQDLRFIGTMMPADEANLAAHARALAIWHKSQAFCGACGSSSKAEAGGNTRRCENPDCGRSLFPRVDPAIIVLVDDGDRCLLGRQATWPEHRYSTIAGFVEPGESLEDAVRREVFEETNIHVSDVEYHSSQPWPFPSSLMLGFFAKATSSDIVLNDGELEDARWFTRDDLTSDFPKLPFRISIARRLVDHWLAAG